MTDGEQVLAASIAAAAAANSASASDSVSAFATSSFGPVLNFPNPFRVSEGTSVSFNLNAPSFSSPIEFSLYNIFGEVVFRFEILFLNRL